MEFWKKGHYNNNNNKKTKDLTKKQQATTTTKQEKYKNYMKSRKLFGIYLQVLIIIQVSSGNFPTRSIF